MWLDGIALDNGVTLKKRIEKRDGKLIFLIGKTGDVYTHKVYSYLIFNIFDCVLYMSLDSRFVRVLYTCTSLYLNCIVE